MRMLTTAAAIAALLAGGAALPVLADGGQRHHGIRHGQSHFAGSYFNRNSPKHTNFTSE